MHWVSTMASGQVMTVILGMSKRWPLPEARVKTDVAPGVYKYACVSKGDAFVTHLQNIFSPTYSLRYMPCIVIWGFVFVFLDRLRLAPGVSSHCFSIYNVSHHRNFPIPRTWPRGTIHLKRPSLPLHDTNASFHANNPPLTFSFEVNVLPAT